MSTPSWESNVYEACKASLKHEGTCLGNSCSQSQEKKELGVAYIKPIHENPINTIADMISME